MTCYYVSVVRDQALKVGEDGIESVSGKRERREYNTRCFVRGVGDARRECCVGERNDDSNDSGVDLRK